MTLSSANKNSAAVICIGLANVDVIARVNDDFLQSHNITKAATTKLDASTTGMILGKLEDPTFHPGGCAANTASGLALMGVDTAFCGKTGDDTYADIFSQGFEENEVTFLKNPHAMKMTSTCLTLVTPDKDRSFALCTDTAGWHLSAEDLPEIDSSATPYVYLEANTAQIKTKTGDTLLNEAVKKYTESGAHLILNLNDKEIVKDSLETINPLLDGSIHFFIGNIAEIHTLFNTHNQEDAFEKAFASGQNFAITDGPNGACIISNGDIVHVPAQRLHMSRIVNTIGAGDQFAAGFIAGLVNDMSHEDACRNGVEAATKIIQTVSARPSKNTKKKATGYLS